MSEPSSLEPRRRSQSKDQVGFFVKAYTVDEFLEAYAMGKTKLYELWKAGSGPAFYMIGKRRMISAAAAERWQVGLEEASSLGCGYGSASASSPSSYVH